MWQNQVTDLATAHLILENLGSILSAENQIIALAIDGHTGRND
jgi:hypothetical protein